MSEPNSPTPTLANVMQDPDAGNSQAQQAGTAGPSTEQQPESARINGLMSTLGRRTNERDTAMRELEQAKAERDDAQRALDELVRQHTAQPSQQDVLAADEAERAPQAPPEPTARWDEGEWLTEKGERLMTEQQWADQSRMAPVTPSRPSAARHDSKKSDLDALNRAITEHMGVPR